ncbi:RNA recognition motif domain-containing protein [Corallincola platygyrae]|uniref:RNA recognition motif domain-containing protein n=1 Tax=Corallincola platygyrae TaxID=1193278 RepID=A0ABW4XJY9_9GAMM
MKLLVRNLARETTQSDLFELFKPFGHIRSCTLVLDKETGKSKGFAFIEMTKAGQAKIAMKSLNNQEVDGSRIRVKVAQSDSDNNAQKRVQPND